MVVNKVGLISEKLNHELDLLIGQAFALNRMLDRGMSLLAVRWKLVQSSKVLHEKAAHAYPSDLFADSISDYQALRDNESIYPATPIGDRNYDSPLDFFLDYHKENLKFEDMIKDTVDEAIEEGDVTTKVFLDGLLSRLTPYIALSQTLVDLATQYGNDAFHLQVMDSVLEKYVNV